MSCLPMVMTGLSELIGSWKTMAISVPSSSRISRSSRPTSSRPMNLTLPERRTLSLGSRFMIERARIVLPDPDSPTTPSVLPRASRKLTPSTALTRPRGVRKWVFRSWTSSSTPVAGVRSTLSWTSTLTETPSLCAVCPDHNRHTCRKGGPTGSPWLAGQAEHTLGDDVALDLAGAAGDAHPRGVEEPVGGRAGQQRLGPSLRGERQLDGELQLRAHELGGRG